jgi:hypothetical protein
MVDTPRKTFPELQALSAPVVDSDVLAVYRSPGPAKRTTASVFSDYMKAFYSASGGSALVGFIQSGTGASARTAQAKFRDSLSVKDFTGALGNGTAADVGFAAARAEAAANGIKRIIIPAGHYLLTDFNASTDGIIWEGDGESSRITVGANNSNVFNVTGTRNTFRGLKIEGNNTSSSSANGNGLYVTAADMMVEDVWFNLMGHAAVSGSTTSALRGPKLIRTRHRSTSAGGTEVFLGGGWQNILIEDADFLTTSAVTRAVLIYNDAAGLWVNAHIRGGSCEGYSLQGVACTDEAWNGTDRVYGFTVDGMYFKSITGTAIKAKLSKGIRIINCLMETCGGTPEDPAAGLYGSILVNSVGEIDVSHNTLRANGDAGIVIGGNEGYPKSLPGGFGLNTAKVSHNIIEQTGLINATYGNGIVLNAANKDIDINHNTIRGYARVGILINCGTDGRQVQFANIANNSILDSPTAALYATDIRACRNVRFDGNVGYNNAFGAFFSGCENVTIGPRDSNGDSFQAGADCYTFVNVTNLVFDGRAACSLYSAMANTTAYTLGQRLHNSAGSAYEVVTAGTTGTGTAPTGTDLTTTYVDGTVRWAFVHKYRQNSIGLNFSGTTNLAKIGANASFEYITGTPLGGSVPSNVKRSEIASGTAVLAAGTVTVNITTEHDAAYRVNLTGDANETFRVSAKAVSSFTITSSNGASTANVDYKVFR